MRALALLTLAVGWVACGPDADGARFEWQSPRYGVGILEGSDATYFQPEDIDALTQQMTDEANREFGLDGDVTPNAVQSVRVELVALPTPCGIDLCNGQELDFKLVVWMAPCKWRTAYAHELAHFLLGFRAHDQDYGHTLYPEMWFASEVELGPCGG